jgi:hypothetical protein
MDVHQQAKGEEGQICTCRIKRRGTDVHQQAKEKRNRCAPAGLRGDGQICTCRQRIRGTDVRQQDKEERDRFARTGKGEEGYMRTSRPKKKRGGCVPVVLEEEGQMCTAG